MLPSLIHWYQWGGDISSPRNNKGTVNFFLSRHVSYSIISCLSPSSLWTKKWNMHKVVHSINFFFWSVFSICRLCRYKYWKCLSFFFFGFPLRGWNHNKIHDIMGCCILLCFAITLCLSNIWIGLWGGERRLRLNQKSHFKAVCHIFETYIFVCQHFYHSQTLKPMVCPSKSPYTLQFALKCPWITAKSLPLPFPPSVSLNDNAAVWTVIFQWPKMEASICCTSGD